jgi:hypothetical protein
MKMVIAHNMLIPIGRQIVPVDVQGELVPANQMIVLALLALVEKYGKEGVLEISQHEAVDLIGKKNSVEIDFSITNYSLRIRAI